MKIELGATLYPSLIVSTVSMTVMMTVSVCMLIGMYCIVNVSYRV